MASIVDLKKRLDLCRRSRKDLEEQIDAMYCRLDTLVKRSSSIEEVIYGLEDQLIEKMGGLSDGQKKGRAAKAR